MVGHVTDSQKCCSEHGRVIDFVHNPIQMRALHGKKVSFDKVIKVVDDMVTLLCKEQVDDDSTKDMCEI